MRNKSKCCGQQDSHTRQGDILMIVDTKGSSEPHPHCMTCGMSCEVIDSKGEAMTNTTKEDELREKLEKIIEKERQSIDDDDSDIDQIMQLIKSRDEQMFSPPLVTKDNRDLEAIAMNIVHQIGDALYEALPKDVAHEHFVTARQQTNDVAIDFAAKLIKEHGMQERIDELSRARTDLFKSHLLESYYEERTEALTALKAREERGND